MSQNPYLEHSYSQHGQGEFQPAEGSGEPVAKSGSFGSKIFSKFRSPFFATLFLLFAGGTFALIIFSSYPGSEDVEAIPVVKAEKTAFKELPEVPGGMEIPNRDSTVYTIMSDGRIQDVNAVENLLGEETAPEESLETLEAFAEEAEALMEDAKPEITEIVSEGTAPEEAVSAESAGQEAVASAKPAVQKIVQETEKIPPQELVKSTQSPKKLHAAGSSPETIAFVRSVLDKKDAKAVMEAPATNILEAGAATDRVPSASGFQDVEPAAGPAPVAGSAIGEGYYVQLGSVTSETGAQSEWGKLQKAFATDLQGLDYRVQSADLGERGVYYRIQAGPLSQDGAVALCDSIKAQKPGGCLVVK